MLDIKIITFLTLSQLKSYTETAKQLHLTQPAVTQHIKKLEDYYNCSLIDFTKRTVKLTKAGEALYRYASMEMYNQQLLINNINGLNKTLNIGATLSLADYFLPKLFAKDNTLKNINLTVANTYNLVESLKNGNIDCAFIEGIFDAGLFEAAVFEKGEFIAVVCVNHPLAKSKSVKLQELFEYTLAIREKGSGTRNILESYLYENNQSISSFKNILEIGNFSVIKSIIKNSSTISFMYKKVAEQEIEKGELTTIDIKDFKIVRPLYFVYNKSSLITKEIKEFYTNIIGE